jgi:tRNA A37 threonylcarbamoyladenosine dehydratase
MLIGKENVERLAGKCVMVVGLGGVGSFAVEALTRSGIGHLILIDGDSISVSNLNRQLFALCSTLGQFKTEVAKARIHDIAPACKVTLYTQWITPDNISSFLQDSPDYIIDAIDQVDAKVALLVEAAKNRLPILSVMGTGNQVTAEHFCIADISKTHNCPLARSVRMHLRKAGIEKGLKVLYSPGPKIKPEQEFESLPGRRALGSISFVPSVAGMLAAGEVVRELMKQSP